MAEIAALRLDSDGTHVIPITGVCQPGETANEDAVGEIRWCRRDGLTFWFEAPLTSLLHLVPERRDPKGGAGSLHAISRDPEWLARTADGFQVRIYATSAETTTNMTNKWDVVTGGRSTSSKRVSGTACYAEVILHRDSPLAFWYETPRSHRLFSPGWELREWPAKEPIEYTIGENTYQRTRRSLPFDGPCDRRLYAEFGKPESPHGVWLTYSPDEEVDPFWFPDPCNHIRGLMSILLGQHVPFVWRDTPVSDERLNRMYFGWHRGVDHEHSRYQLVPAFGTIEALKYGKEVTDRLNDLQKQFAELCGLFDPEWVVSPMWSAARDFIDNQLALACIVLERLSAAYQDKVRPTGRYPKPPALMNSKQKDKLLTGFRTVLKEIAQSEGLTEDASRIVGKRIENLFQPTNNDRLLMVFEELGIPLVEDERAAIKNRNLCMHGHVTLKDSNDTAQSGEELRYFDILRTLIGRAVLHLLGYDGPYVDYGARPDAANSPILYCTLPPLNAVNVPPH